VSAPARLEAVTSGRVPPHDLDAEAAVLSACMLEPEAYFEIADLLAPGDFYSPANKRIWSVVQELAAKNEPIDAVTVAGVLKDRERLVEVGGVAYLSRVVDATPAVTNIRKYAQMVRTKSRLRSMISAAQSIVSEGYGDVGDAQKWLDEAEHRVFEVARAETSDTCSTLFTLVNDNLKQLQAVTAPGGVISGTPTGFEGFDDLVSGLHEGDLNIVAGRPGMGKTAFVTSIAVNVAALQPAENRPELHVALFSLEMPKEQISTRMLCSEARVDISRVRKGRLLADHWAQLTDAARFLSTLPVHIDDRAGITPLYLRAKVRQLQSRLARSRDGIPRKVGLVIVDYLQLMNSVGKHQNREGAISEISRQLKEIAKELRVPIIALSQLNRAVETRAGGNKRPQLSDLRESGAIEQDADAVIFIYRDEYYNKGTTQLPGIAEIIVAKQRNGPTGKVPVRFTSSCTRFDNLAQHEQMALPDSIYEDQE
jgi:replicative DNA helicase